MLLREIERREDLAGCLATCIEVARAPSKVQHSLEEIIRFRILIIAAGYEDANDAGTRKQGQGQQQGEGKPIDHGA
ncbi:Transposase DDE domain group 1 [Paracoccus alcaliphilus]|uniref:Transposase DDE domain group 1 n=1 Tax=Paracoccus alcaliphilus TaxID=34002 RepID=A0A1H8NZM9_9RHOB|nr:transposase [Paracoccus alcaliphilus]SEO35057.1 Transposase DDE domain group 1 [Paracoccus alcaliphilus]